MGIQSGVLDVSKLQLFQKLPPVQEGFENEGLVCICGGKVDETGFCESCKDYISEDFRKLALGNTFRPEQYVPGQVSNVFKGINGISEGDIVGVYEFNRQKFECKVLSIRGLKGKFKEFKLQFGSSVIKIETNGLQIRKYASQRKTKLGRGSGTKWQITSPTDKIRLFLESCFLRED